MTAMDEVVEPLVSSYASVERQAAYLRAMDKRAGRREPGRSMRVYVSAPPGLQGHKQWSRWLRAIRSALPDGLRSPSYRDVFSTEQDYESRWPTYSEGVDGLVLLGWRDNSSGSRIAVGPVAREELKAFVATGRPVLVFVRRFGLVPLVDCDPIKSDSGDSRLRLQIPEGGSPQASTLAAALRALTPLPAQVADAPVPAARSAIAPAAAAFMQPG